MAELETDDEKVEAIRKWWKENGVAIVVGVAVGLAGVFGWRAWVDYRDSVGQHASLAYEQLIVAATGGARASAEKQAEAIIADYGNTPYAMFADLALAKARVGDGDLAGAAEALRAAIGRAPDPGLAKLAAYRLARVLIAQGDLAAAAKVIDEHDDGGAFSADFAGLRGDIAAAEGRTAEARAAYTEAVAGGAGLAEIIELKLADLPSADAS